mgnify:FL=1
MHRLVVPLEEAKKCLKGHEAYLPALEQEYINPKAFGNINDVLVEMDEMTDGDELEWDREFIEWMDQCDTMTRFVTLAMMGTRPGDTDWG